MPFSHITLLVVSYLFARDSTAELLPFEKAQLHAEEIASFQGPASSFLSFDDLSSSSRLEKAQSHGCKVFPGDPVWPSEEVWDNLNYTLGGVLEKTVPLAKICYDGPDYVSSLICTCIILADQI